MCGFVGTIVPRTGHVLNHRGPDGSGSTASLAWAHVSLEMTRLAIVDRRSIDVPFDFRASCGVLLAFNGEVYNHRELRVELSDGTPWQTDCDAEVVARGWRRWGVGVLDHLNGMFGLCLVDERSGEVLLVRDRAGEKPLYYARLGSGVAFASEVKALPMRLEEAPCEDVSVFEFDCLEETPFKGVRRLGPGQYLHFQSALDLEAPVARSWWELGSEADEAMTYKEAVDALEATLVDAIRIRARAAVKVGVQVSGGLDSAIVQAVAKSEYCYTVTFPEDGVDCLPLARLAAGCEPVPVTFGLADLERVLPDVAYHLDTPGTWTAVCQWFLDHRMAEDGCVIVLSGEGADELFGGYARYRLLYWMERARADARLAEYAYARGRLHGTDEEVLARMIDRSPRGEARTRALEVVNRFARGDGLLARAMRVEFYTTMQVLLRMADKMAAAVSMENRSVFFDHRVMELAARIPVKHKVTERESKAVLLDVARRLGVPSDVVEQKNKRGLFVPWAKWWYPNRKDNPREWDRGPFAHFIKEAWRGRFFQ